MKKVVGWFLYLCYKLQTHCIAQISTRNWLWFTIVVPPVLVFFRHLALTHALLLMLVGGLMLLGTEWARRKGYLIFEPAPLGKDTVVRSPIAVDERVVGWASGLFAVGEKQRYVVNEAAQFSYVRTREHVVMAHIEQTRFLLLASSVKGGIGWWYVFFMPDRVQRVETGYVWCGIKARPGLALSYRAKENPCQEATVYLAFADVDTIQRVIADLRMDVSPQAFVNR